jgi:ferredoxin--NADP+ reductase
MAAYNTETVLTVHHWNDTLFSFTTTRNKGLRFRSGHFLMIGLEVDGKPLVRAYSVASPNYEEHLEFLSIKVQDGPLTSRLQKIQVGDPILVSEKSVEQVVSRIAMVLNVQPDRSKNMRVQLVGEYFKWIGAPRH